MLSVKFDLSTTVALFLVLYLSAGATESIVGVVRTHLDTMTPIRLMVIHRGFIVMEC